MQVGETTFDLDSVLKKLAYSDEQIKSVMTSDVLLVPDDLDANESHFVDRAVTLKKKIEASVKVTVVTRQGSKHHYYAHRAAEINIPLLVFLGWQAFDISKALLASWVYDQIERFKSQERKPGAKLSWLVIDGGKIEQLNYEGPADKLPIILNKFKHE